MKNGGEDYSGYLTKGVPSKHYYDSEREKAVRKLQEMMESESELQHHDGRGDRQ